MRGSAFPFVVFFSFAAALISVAATARGADPAGSEFYEKRIRPLLVEHCYACHGTEKQRAGLRLDNITAIHDGGDRGPAIDAEKPDDSLLIRAVRYSDDKLRMPPKGKLSETNIADLVTWIKMGAPGPATIVTPPVAASAIEEFDLAKRRQHWAYQPVRASELPAVKRAAWCASPIDNYILSKLEAAELAPARPADKRTLLRRVTFDLIGLPPTAQEIDDFLADNSVNAFAKVVDRLLASPHYGERWGRHWLDLVRYAETLAFEFDYDLYNSWRYRDYVIRAFNDDVPYDQFVIEHLAGDLLEKPRRHSTEGTNESIVATGFFWMGEGKQSPIDIRQEQADRIDNQLDVLGKAFLAQTIACARCHDHKFDAISTRDYYALAGYLRSSRYQQAFLDPPERIAGDVRKLSDLKTQLRRDILSDTVGPREQIGQISKYLFAARGVLRSISKPEDTDTAVAHYADDGVLNAKRLMLWVKALQQAAKGDADHPLALWVSLAPPEDIKVTNAEFKLRRQAFQETLVRKLLTVNEEVIFEDFLSPAYSGWHVTGDAFGTGLSRAGELVVGDSAKRPVARLTLGGAESCGISDRLQGEMRSRTFTIEKPYIHYRLSGRNARVNLVIDGYTLIMNPMYGGLTIEAREGPPVWRTMDVRQWLGHRAFIELSDSRVPPQRLNPPPSTARVPEGPQDAFLSLQEIRFSNEAKPVVVSSRIHREVLDALLEDSELALAAAYQKVILQELDRWETSVRKGEAADAEGVALLNVLLEQGLLDSAWRSESLEKLRAEYQQIAETLPAPSRAPALADGTGEDEYIFLRGNYHTPGERAPRSPPEVIAGAPQPVPSQGSGRLELARRLVDPLNNPLLTRVLVNRVWQHHFGEGIVRTPDDFGRMGQPPSHPELLDYLTAEFVRDGWSIKALHRRMLLTSSYQQSAVSNQLAETNPQSAISPDPKSIDPENRLLHHMPVRRLEAECVRDGMLGVSGRLNRTPYGPSVLPHLTPHMEGRGRPNPGPLDGEGRRSIYINARRNFLSPLLLAFDYPATFSTLGRRDVSTAPAQALTLMNDPFVVGQARLWAARSLSQPELPTSQRIENLYRDAFARPPTRDEFREALSFLEREAARHDKGMDEPAVWADLCHVLFNVKEFIFVD